MRQIILAKGDNLVRFVRKLDACERAAKTRHDVSAWEETFIKYMRNRFNSREDSEDLGIDAWNPSVSQWNTLNEIYLRVM